MKTCLFCGVMISPHPMHKETTGICAKCFREQYAAAGGDPSTIPDDATTDSGRPKLKGKHMVVTKSPEQKTIEQRKKNRSTAGW